MESDDETQKNVTGLNISIFSRRPNFTESSDRLSQHVNVNDSRKFWPIQAAFTD